MKSKKVSVKLQKNTRGCDIEIGRDLLGKSGGWAKTCLGQKALRIALISNNKVFRLYGEEVKMSLETAGFDVNVFLIKDGERYKNFRTLENVLNFFSEAKLSRTDAAVALGGGVVGDLAGFASAVYLRGIFILQIPTTLVAMIDSSVGGKTAVNTRFGKNLVGAFHQPGGVLIDIKTLQTLPQRELTSGFCEAVKQGAISGKKLFNQTADFLQKYPREKFRQAFSNNNFLDRLENLITDHIAFKAAIVRQDEREAVGRTDSKSRKILNFGHTFAHALENITGYKYFRHGEAVGYGIIFDSELSKILEMLDENELKLLNDVVHRAGALPIMPNIDPQEVFEAFKFDKKLAAKSLQLVLLKGIGHPVILSDKDIPHSAIKLALKKVLKK